VKETSEEEHQIEDVLRVPNELLAVVFSLIWIRAAVERVRRIYKNRAFKQLPRRARRN